MGAHYENEPGHSRSMDLILGQPTAIRCDEMLRINRPHLRFGAVDWYIPHRTFENRNIDK